MNLINIKGIQKRRYFDTVLVQADTAECEFNSLSIWRGFMPLHLYKYFLFLYFSYNTFIQFFLSFFFRYKHGNETPSHEVPLKKLKKNYLHFKYFRYQQSLGSAGNNTPHRDRSRSGSKFNCRQGAK